MWGLFCLCLDRLMESASDVVTLIVALGTAVPALVAGTVGVVKANNAQSQIVAMRQEIQQASTQAVNVTNQQVAPEMEQRRKEDPI